MKIGWLGNREGLFNNFSYIKNALSNTHYWFFKELIEKGCELYFLGKTTSVRQKDLAALNSKYIQEYNDLSKTNELSFCKHPEYCISLKDKINVCNEGWKKIFVGFKEEEIKNGLAEYRKDEYFVDVDLDAIFVDNFINMNEIGYSVRLKTLMERYKNASIFLYDEAGEWVDTMFDSRLGFTDEDYKRIIVLGTYARQAKYCDLPFKGVETFFYSFVDKYLPINESPEFDTIYIGRMMDARKKQYEEFLNLHAKCKIKVNTDFNLSKHSNGKILFLDESNAPAEKLEKQKKTLQYIFYEKYKDVKWNMIYTLPCNLYEEYNNCKFTYVPMPTHRANYGLITLRPWDATTAGIITVYGKKFYDWQNFTDEEFICTESNSLENIVDRIKKLDKNEYRNIIDRNRQRFETFTAKKLAEKFFKIYEFYKTSTKEIPFVKRSNKEDL